MPTGSPPGSLNTHDWTKIGKGAGIALAGSLLAYVGQSVLPVLEGTSYAYLAPLGAVLVNLGLKFVTNTQH